MFCNVKTSLSSLKRGMRQSAFVLLLWAVVTPFFLCISFSVLKRMWMGNAAEYCVGDFINSLNRGTLMNFFILPFTVCVVFLVSERDNTANCILKFRTRTRLLENQYMKILLLSLLFPVVLVLTAFIIAGFFTNSLMNWGEKTSLFYKNYGYTLNIGFVSVLALTACRLFVKLLFFLIVMIWSGLRFQKIFSFLILFVLSAARVFDFFQFEVSKIFNLVKEESYFLASEKIVYFVLTPILILLLACVSFKAVKRKDFVGT